VGVDGPGNHHYTSSHRKKRFQQMTDRMPVRNNAPEWPLVQILISEAFVGQQFYGKSDFIRWLLAFAMCREYG